MIGYQALHDAAGLVDRSPAGAVVVWGDDAFDFLQSLVSQDLSRLDDGQGAHSLLLQPTGKLDVEFRVLCVGAAAERQFWLDTEPGFGGRLADSLNRFKIRVRAEIADRGEEWGRVSLRGPAAIGVVERAARVEVPAAAHGHVRWGDVRVVRADWPGLRGVDVIGPRAAVDAAVPTLVDHGAVPASEAAWETVRIECGVPRMGVDLDESVIPQEAFLEQVAVSFDKGCFLGQELVCRIKDRGHVNRHLRRLRFGSGSSAVPPIGAEIAHDRTTAGAITSAAESPERGAVVALGYLRREVPPGADVVVRWDGAEAAAVVEEIVLAG